MMFSGCSRTISVSSSLAHSPKGRHHHGPNYINHLVRRIGRKSEYLFPAQGGRPFSSWSDTKQEFDVLCGISDWVVHDLRRTFATKMAEWQLAQPHLIERLL